MIHRREMRQLDVTATQVFVAVSKVVPSAQEIEAVSFFIQLQPSAKAKLGASVRTKAAKVVFTVIVVSMFRIIVWVRLARARPMSCVFLCDTTEQGRG